MFYDAIKGSSGNGERDQTPRACVCVGMEDYSAAANAQRVRAQLNEESDPGSDDDAGAMFGAISDSGTDEEEEADTQRQRKCVPNHNITMAYGTIERGATSDHGHIKVYANSPGESNPVVLSVKETEFFKDWLTKMRRSELCGVSAQAIERLLKCCESSPIIFPKLMPWVGVCELKPTRRIIEFLPREKTTLTLGLAFFMKLKIAGFVEPSSEPFTGDNGLFLSESPGGAIHLLLAKLFVKELNASGIKERGFAMSYRDVQAAHSTVRGRILFGEQIRKRPYQEIGAAPLEMRFNELTFDTEENQLIRAAVERLLRQSRDGEIVADDNTIVELQCAMRQLNMVQVTTRSFSPIDIAVFQRQFRVTPLNRRYARVLNASCWVIKNTTWDNQDRGLLGFEFFDNINILLEEFTRREFQENMPGYTCEKDTFPSHSLEPDMATGFELAPDLVIKQDRHVLCVGDVKNKCLEEGQNYRNREDLLQILAYMFRTGVDFGFLIYAAIDGELKRQRDKFSLAYTFTHGSDADTESSTEFKVVTYYLNLSQTEGSRPLCVQIQEQLKRICEDVVEQINSAGLVSISEFCGSQKIEKPEWLAKFEEALTKDDRLSWRNRKTTINTVRRLALGQGVGPTPHLKKLGCSLSFWYHKPITSVYCDGVDTI